ncbi:hypothetical protein ACRALDRAFT_208024 [Sodiomyces alcalophilus JCM 7366]|uniref:uncharacterized protein n=1 Tax=Sodiomyces alcalophilus JCM 7366 TaxID=591952 RepID=UPI0039B46B2F
MQQKGVSPDTNPTRPSQTLAFVKNLVEQDAHGGLDFLWNIGCRDPDVFFIWLFTSDEVEAHATASLEIHGISRSGCATQNKYMSLVICR